MTQWKAGRLVDSVRDHAISAIDAGPGDWADAKNVKRREFVLEKTRAQLLSPQRAPTRVRPVRHEQSPFSPGDVLRYTCSNGREVAMWAIETTTHENLTAMSMNTLFELLAFGEPTLPAVAELLAAPPVTRPPNATTGRRDTIRLVFVWPQDAVGPQWTVLANAPVPPERSHRSGNTVVPTKRADEVFRSWYERLIGAQATGAAWPSQTSHSRTGHSAAVLLIARDGTTRGPLDEPVGLAARATAAWRLGGTRSGAGQRVQSSVQSSAICGTPRSEISEVVP